MIKSTESTTKTPDTLDELLNQIAQGTEFHFQSGLCGDWTLTAREPDKAAIHLITEGDCWFGFPSDQAAVRQLHAGDVIFVNQGVSHFISYQPVPNHVTEQEIAQFCQPEHRQSGMAPKRLVDQLRLQRARILLSTGNATLERIAEQLGYQSATAFSRFFKRYTGVSARHYRQAGSPPQTDGDRS